MKPLAFRGRNFPSQGCANIRLTSGMKILAEQLDWRRGFQTIDHKAFMGHEINVVDIIQHFLKMEKRGGGEGRGWKGRKNKYLGLSYIVRESTLS